MQLIRTHDASKKLVDDFLSQNVELNPVSLMNDGYIVSVEDRIAGCFILDQFNDHSYWLRQLHITKGDTMKLPVIIEAILALAGEKNANDLYVNSHHVMVDIILEALQFHSTLKPTQSKRKSESNGKWWIYRIV